VNCREFVEFLMDYLEDELPERQRSVFESHLGICPSCVTYLDTYREAVRLGHAVCRGEDAPVPEDAPEELVRAILAARRA